MGLSSVDDEYYEIRIVNNVIQVDCSCDTKEIFYAICDKYCKNESTSNIQRLFGKMLYLEKDRIL